MSTSQSNRSSGTFTRVLFGSIVQNGKFSAGIAQFVSALYNVDFPTFGMPTMPTFRLDENRPKDHGPRGSSSTASFFFGGILLFVFFKSRLAEEFQRRTPRANDVVGALSFFLSFLATSWSSSCSRAGFCVAMMMMLMILIEKKKRS